MSIKNYLLDDSIVIEKIDDLEEISDKNPNFFTEVGELIDSLDNEQLSDDTVKVIDELIQKIIDVLLSLGDEEFDDNTNKQFMDIVKIMDLDDEIDEGLLVKSRKVNSGKKKSQASRLRGAEKMKYLKRLKANRKKYNRSALLKNKVKRKSKKYRKSAKGKRVAKRYKTLNKK